MDRSDRVRRGCPTGPHHYGLSVLPPQRLDPYTEYEDMEMSGRASKPPASLEFAKAFIKLTVAGGIAFWAGTIALSLFPIAAEYRAALSLSYFQTVFVESLVAGMIVGGCVTFVLLRFFEKLPTKNAILKSEILSFVALAILSILVQVASTRVGGTDALRVFLIGMALNVPRFFLLGFAVGYLYRPPRNRAIRTTNIPVGPG